DMTMSDVPAGIVLCFRGPDPALTSTVVANLPSPTWCDTKVPAGRGAFQFQQHHAADNSGALLGVHGFVRSLKGDGSLLSGTVDIDGIPPIVQGQFGGDAGGADV